MKLKDFLKKEIRAILQEEEGAPAAADDAPPPVKGKTRLKTRGRGYGKCPDVADKIQVGAREVIDSFEPEEEQDDKALERLKSRLNDKKLGNTTLGVVNTYISAIGKSPFPYNQKGYNEACKLTQDEIGRLITAMKKQPEKLVVAATTPQPAPPTTPAADQSITPPDVTEPPRKVTPAQAQAMDTLDAAKGVTAANQLTTLDKRVLNVSFQNMKSAKAHYEKLWGEGGLERGESYIFRVGRNAYKLITPSFMDTLTWCDSGFNCDVTMVTDFEPTPQESFDGLRQGTVVFKPEDPIPILNERDSGAPKESLQLRGMILQEILKTLK